MSKITIELDETEIKLLKKRAEQNLLSLREQIEDIIRRSCANVKSSRRPFKFDDRLVGIFSRQKTGRKKKKQPKKQSKKK
tara:strand:+ start:113 stop:352 length:240 start_codon:yes stop_codon:yes gene_type:complete